MSRVGSVIEKSQQEVAFLENAWKIKGFGSLREDVLYQIYDRKMRYRAVAWLKNG